MREREPAVDLGLRPILRREESAKLFGGIDLARVLVAKLGRTLEQAGLDRFEQGPCPGNEVGLRGKFFFFRPAVSATDRHRTFFDVARSDFHAERNALLDPLPIFDTAARIAAVDLRADRFAEGRLRAELRGEFFGGFEDSGAGFLFGQDRKNDDLRGRDAGRQDEPVVIRMRHDECPDKARADTPAGGPGELATAVTCGEFDSGGAGEILSEKMRCPRLDRLAVLHHGLDAKRAHRAGKSFAFRFFAGKDGQREVLTGEFFVNAEHLVRLGHRFLHRLVRCVAFLPEEFCGA